MSKAIRIHRAGGPEEMLWEDVEVPAPAEGEVQVRHTAIGLNYIDVYDRTGLYPMPLPGVLGREAAGVVTAIGRKAKGFRKGDRVAYVHTVPGSYSELRNVPAARLVKLPRSVSDEQAAAIMLKGLTAEYLLRRTCRVQRGDWILVHAAVGGVGLILCQWAKALGARVIGVVGSEARSRSQRRAGVGTCSSWAATSWWSRSSRSPRAQACAWSTTRSARIPSWTRSTVSRRSA